MFKKAELEIYELDTDIIVTSDPNADLDPDDMGGLWWP